MSDWRLRAARWSRSASRQPTPPSSGEADTQAARPARRGRSHRRPAPGPGGARCPGQYGLGEVLHRGQDDTIARARRFRDALEELGPTFAKLGQILSTRPDLLPAAVVDELASLQDHVAPLSEAEIVAVMEKELKVPWEDVFASIEPDPMASGTIAQVHRATLAGGERVVVKVQRPTAETEIRQDLGLLQQFAAKVGQRPAFQQVVDVPAIIEHLSSSLLREHPGNLMWWDQKIYLLDLGMAGEVDAGVRESLLLLLLAFWQEDTHHSQGPPIPAPG